MARRRPAARQPIEHRILLTATLCLLAAGAVMVYSASSARTLLQGQGDGTAYLVKYLIYGGLGLVAMQALARIGLDAVRRATGPLLVTSFVLLVAVKIPHVGIEVNGARRWLGAGPLQFQPSELMKVALVLYAVRVLSDKPKRVRSPKALLNPLGLVLGAALLLVASQPDLGTALVIAFTMIAVLVAAGVPLRYLAISLGVGAVLVALFAIAEPYRRARLTSFLDPWSHANGSGFQAVQGQIAIGSGGLTGRGLGASIEKVFFLPEAHTDFILAVIGEEIGVIGVWALLFLYGLVGYGGLQAARRARGAYAALLATGITALILSQALLNVFAVLGLAPLTGVPLPFISSGSSSLLVLLAGMGLLLNVANGGQAHLRPVSQGSRGESAQADPHRGRRDGGARRAGAGSRRRAAG
jgi:cell division protein FtsW